MKKLLISLLIATTSLWAAEEEVPMTTFVFEGEVTEIAPEFAGTFSLGDVLSGTVGIKESGRKISLDPFAPSYYQEYRSTFYQPDFIIDRNRIEISSGYGGYTMNLGNHMLRVTDVQPGQGMSDKIELFLLMTMSSVSEAKYTYAWLEIQLMDSSGEMVDSLNPPQSPPKFEEGSFSLSYASEDDNTTIPIVKGTITVFGKLEGRVDPEPTKAELVDIVYALDEAVTDRDAYIQELLAALKAAQERIQSLEGKVTLLEESLRAAEGTQLAAELEAQNAIMRKQLREAAAQEAATAEIIRALKASESSLKNQLAEQAVEVPVTPVEQTTVKVAPPPMLARPTEMVSPGVVETIEPLNEVGAPTPSVLASGSNYTQDPAGQSPVVLPATGNSLFTEGLQQAVEKQQEALEAREVREEQTSTRRGPRR